MFPSERTGASSGKSLLVRQQSVNYRKKLSRYVACAAGAFHSVLLRDDGQAVAFGRGT